MRNFFYDGTRFKNGNCNLRFSPEEIQDVKAKRFSDIEMLSFKMETLDLYFFGEQFCLNNYEMGVLIYSAYSDMLFLLVYSDIDKYLMQGKTLKLYARKPNKEEREIIEKGDF